MGKEIKLPLTFILPIVRLDIETIGNDNSSPPLVPMLTMIEVHPITHMPRLGL